MRVLSGEGGMGASLEARICGDGERIERVEFGSVIAELADILISDQCDNDKRVGGMRFRIEGEFDKSNGFRMDFLLGYSKLATSTLNRTGPGSTCYSRALPAEVNTQRATPPAQCAQLPAKTLLVATSIPHPPSRRQPKRSYNFMKLQLPTSLLSPPIGLVRVFYAVILEMLTAFNFLEADASRLQSRLHTSLPSITAKQWLMRAATLFSCSKSQGSARIRRDLSTAAAAVTACGSPRAEFL